MTVATTDPIVDSYLKRLRAKARPLPQQRREELLQQIREHLDEALPPGSDEVEVRNALERLGDPETIVAEEFDRLGIKRARAGMLEWLAVFLLVFGSWPFPFVGWTFGVILLWASRVWSTREKLIGTLVPPGGLSAVLFLAVIGASTCTSGSSYPGHRTIERCSGGVSPAIGIPLFILFVIGGIVTPIFLVWRANASR